VRNLLNKSDLPANVTELLLSSCSDSTWKQYNVYIKKWSLFCSSVHINNISCNINYVLVFLTNLYTDGVGYSGLNTARSALSLVLSPIDGMSIGKHPLVIRLIKAVWRSRPPKPRYNSVWDASVVLECFKNWPCNENLDLKQLSLKLVGLLALVTAQRVQTLSKIKLSNIKGVLIKETFIDEMLKTSASSRKQPCLYLKPYSLDSKLCIVMVLDEFIKRTAVFRATDNLFLSFSSPHNPVGSETLSRWLKSLLRICKIDTDVYKGHSFRHASTSKASSKGVDVNLIFSSAGWTENSSVFARFYEKPIDNRNTYAEKVLEC